MTLAIQEADEFAGLERLVLQDDGETPNSPHPVLLYRQVLESDHLSADAVRELFARHGWPGAWVDGIFTHHHYHSTAHEVLGFTRGWVEVQLGGRAGPQVRIEAGDVAVLPAGIGHKNVGASGDLQVVGAYPRGQSADHCTASQADRMGALANLDRVALPAEDPVFGGPGLLREHWAV